MAHHDDGTYDDLELSHESLGDLLAHVAEGVILCDADGTIRFASPSIRSLLGYHPTSLVGRNVLDYVHPDEVEELVVSLARWAGRAGTPRGQVQRIRASNGTYRELDYDTTVGAKESPFGIVITIRPAEETDAEQRELTHRLLNEERLVRLASLFVELPWDRFEEGLGRAVTELAGLEWVTRVSVWLLVGDRIVRRVQWSAPMDAPSVPLPDRIPADRSPVVDWLTHVQTVHLDEDPDPDPDLDDGRQWFRDAGVELLSVAPMMADGRFSGLILLESTFEGAEFDVSHSTTTRSAAAILSAAFVRHAAEIRLVEQASTDPVTGLGSRWAFDEAMLHALATVEAGATVGLGVALLDIDRFKLVNDALGHSAGDRLLAELAARLQEAASEETVLARLGGDDLLVLFPDEPDLASCAARARSLVDALRAPFEIDGHPITLSASVGVVHTGDGGTDPTELLRRADLAMYRAKSLGGDQVAVDDEHLRDQVVARLTRESELRDAVAGDGLMVYFQGEWSLEDDSLLGAEALARWNHPSMGVLAAGEFIPMAEEVGLIDALGERVLREACRSVAGWRAEGLASAFVLRVNLAARQLRQPRLVEQVADALVDSGLPADCLCLELTESSLLVDPDGSLAVLRRLRDLGVGLAVDDFGTGYSSLLYLKRLPITSLKIDQAFVQGLPDDARDRAIVRSTVELAAALGFSSTAEGVETVGQKRALTELGCRRAQGFLLARPEPSAVFRDRLIGSTMGRSLA